MSFRQIAIQAASASTRSASTGRSATVPCRWSLHHLDITDRPERGAQPEQVIAQMLCPRSLKLQSAPPGCSAVGARPPASGGPRPGCRGELPTRAPAARRSERTAGRHRPTGAAQVRRRGSAYLPQSTPGATPPLGLRRGRCRWALALCYPSVASLMLPASNGGAMAAVTAST